MIRKILLTVFIILAGWASGFCYYLYLINSYKLNSNTTDAIIVTANGDYKVEAGISLLKAAYAPILFISNVENSGQIQNLLKERNVMEQQVIIASNNSDYIKEIKDFILIGDLNAVRLVEYNYNMPLVMNKIASAVSSQS
ncbi:MAG: YdcF family protein [Rickettsia endosymbiont of Pentastiridius leporinus]